ncbi:FxLYD domain-containing protein [Krasilnikoviella flava]|uniref:DUF4190 domain-containing protein n=1 Tax=Krasilnikoviella flava TaxID=526729 RepID=A0A1T5JIW8_9MICO|nr:FxLYD domain-containing protein [Krasilnikoviella flava]SKC51335.1 hypothetical protein SAMN04324258_1438 [Krasilnikoviella flava]
MSQTVPPAQGIPVPPAPGQPMPGAPAQAPNRGNALAVTGFVLALVGFLLCLVPVVNVFAIVLAVVGLVLAVIGLVKTRKGAPRKGLAVAGIVLAVLGGVGGGVSAAVYGAAADAAIETLDDASADLDKMTGDATEQVLAEDVSVEIGDFTAEEDEFGLVTTGLPVTLTNTSDETQSFMVTIDALDESGNRVAQDIAYSNELAAGQSEKVDLFQFVERGDLDAMRSATFEVVEATAL